MPKASKSFATLSRVNNLPDGESVYRIRIHDTSTYDTVYRSRDGRWTLDDRSRPHGTTMQWATLADVRADLHRMATKFVFHPTGNGLVQLGTGYRPRDITESLVIAGREPVTA